VDEYSALTCKSGGIGSAKPGDSCPIQCSVEPTVWRDMKINLAGNEEELEYSGKELLVQLTDPAGCQHHFHVRKDDAKSDPVSENGRIKIVHWHIADLIEHFHIPIPKDIATLHPEKYQAHINTIDALQARINHNLSKAS
jgi:hypothetical protein